MSRFLILIVARGPSWRTYFYWSCDFRHFIWCNRESINCSHHWRRWCQSSVSSSFRSFNRIFTCQFYCWFHRLQPGHLGGRCSHRLGLVFIVAAITVASVVDGFQAILPKAYQWSASHPNCVTTAAGRWRWTEPWLSYACQTYLTGLLSVAITVSLRLAKSLQFII